MTNQSPDSRSGVTEPLLSAWQKEERIYKRLLAGLAICSVVQFVLAATVWIKVSSAAQVFEKHGEEFGSIWSLCFHSVERGRIYSSFEVWSLWKAHLMLEYLGMGLGFLSFGVVVFTLRLRLQRLAISSRDKA